MLWPMVKESPRGGVPVAGGAPTDRPHPVEPIDTQQAKLAHDVNNPLAIITTNLDYALAALETGRPGDELCAAIREAREAAGRLSLVFAKTAVGRSNQPDEPPISAVASAAAGFAGPELGSGTLRRISGTARILVVDDEPSLGAALRRCLRDYDVVVTASGREALALLTKGEVFDFILCDLSMPGMGGDELYTNVMDLVPEQAERFVFITGGATTPRAQAFIDSVRNHVLHKPFDVSQLREMIRSRLAASRT